MAFKGAGTTAVAPTNGRPEPYFKRLEPIELEYDGAEVRIFDDRELNNEIKVQFWQLSGGKRKCAVFTLEEETFVEFLNDLGTVYRQRIES